MLPSLIQPNRVLLLFFFLYKGKYKRSKRLSYSLEFKSMPYLMAKIIHLALESLMIGGGGHDMEDSRAFIPTSEYYYHMV